MSITPFNSVGGYSTGLTGYTVIDAVGGISAAGGTFSGNISAPNIVTSINGATGAITNVAKTNAANTFTGLQTFSGGLSGNLTGAATLADIQNINAGTRYICMVGGTGQTGIFVDAVTTPLTYLPALGRMSMTSLVVTGSGSFTTINSSSIDANSQLIFNGPDGGAFTSVNNDAWLYFDVPNGDVSFGDIQGVSTGLLYAFIPKLNLGVLSSQNAGNAGKAKFGINRDGTGWTASGYGIELGRDNGKMLRMVYVDGIAKQSDASPTANATFELSNNGDLTIKPSGGDVTISGSLTVTGNATFDGNTTIGNAATDTTTIYGTKIVNEGVYANGSLRTANISFANGQVQTLTGVGTGATGTTAIYFTDAPSSGAASVTMIITNGGLMTGTGMTAWGGNIKWPGGIKPVLSSSGIDVVSFVTPDAGTTIYGFVGGLNFT